MGDGVFGIPITDANLIPIDRAREALQSKNSDGKDERARNCLRDLKDSCGHDMGTLCLIYNATGDTLKYALKNDWAGHIGSSPYPIQIANGQWGAFLHVNDKHPENKYEYILSIGAVAYHGKDADGADCDWLLAWRSKRTGGSVYSTSAYNEVRERDHFSRDNLYHIAATELDRTGVYYSDDNNVDHWEGTSSCASIGNDNFPILTAILTLEGA